MPYKDPAAKRRNDSERGKRKRAEDPRYRREYFQRWAVANREKVAGYTQEWRKRNPEHAQDYYASRLGHRYGLRPGEYDAMFAAQGGVCAICGAPPERMRLAVDHDHTTGAVRGLLCGRCNGALGLFRDHIPLLHAAERYLTQAIYWPQPFGGG